MAEKRFQHSRQKPTFRLNLGNQAFRIKCKGVAGVLRMKSTKLNSHKRQSIDIRYVIAHIYTI